MSVGSHQDSHGVDYTEKYILTYDSLNNPFKPTEDADKSVKPWMYFKLPVQGICCMKVLNLSVKYLVDSTPDTMSGFLTIKTSKRLQSKINDKGIVEILKDYEVNRNPFSIHIPMAMPGTTNPKPLTNAVLNLKDLEHEIKICISDQNQIPVVVERAVLVMELIPYRKKTTF